MKNPSEKEPISLSLPCELVEYLDRFCDQQDLNRSQVATKALKIFLVSQFALTRPLADILDANEGNSK